MATNSKCAPACRRALIDASTRSPNRNKASDGCLGDAAHAQRHSDHNPDASGYAHAFDLTHDPQNGIDCYLLSREAIKDPRVKYVIFAGQIYRTYAPSLGWAAYQGVNAHAHHMHVSIKPHTTFDISPWPWAPQRDVEKRLSAPPTLSRGDHNEWVRIAQIQLGTESDAIFGAAMEAAVREYQALKGLEVDGIIGPETWHALTEGVV